MNEYLNQTRCGSSQGGRSEGRSEGSWSHSTSGAAGGAPGPCVANGVGSSSFALDDDDFGGEMDGFVAGWSDRDEFSIFADDASRRPKTAFASMSGPPSSSGASGPGDEFYEDITRGAGAGRPFSALPLSRTKYRLGHPAHVIAASSGGGATAAGGAAGHKRDARAPESNTNRANIRRRSTHKITFRRASGSTLCHGKGAEEDEIDQSIEHGRLSSSPQLQPPHEFSASTSAGSGFGSHVENSKATGISNTGGSTMTSGDRKALPERKLGMHNRSRRRTSGSELGTSPSNLTSNVAHGGAKTTWGSNAGGGTGRQHQQNAPTTTTTTFMNSLSQPYPLNSHKQKQPISSAPKRGNLRDILRLQPVLKAVNGATSPGSVGSGNIHSIESSHRKETEIHHHHLHQLQQQEMQSQQSHTRGHHHLHSAGSSRSSLKKDDEVTTRSVLRMRPHTSTSPPPRPLPIAALRAHAK